MDFGFFVVPSLFPGDNLFGDEVLAVDATAQALPVHDADLDFRHVQPTAVFGGVVELHSLQQPSGFRRLESFIEGGPAMGVQVVQHQTRLKGVWIAHVQDLAQTESPVNHRAPLTHEYFPPTAERLNEQNLTAHTFPFVLMVTCKGRTESVAAGGDRRAVRKRSALGNALLRIVTDSWFSPAVPSPAARSRKGVPKHGEMDRDSA